MESRPWVHHRRFWDEAGRVDIRRRWLPDGSYYFLPPLVEAELFSAVGWWRNV